MSGLLAPGSRFRSFIAYTLFSLPFILFAWIIASDFINQPWQRTQNLCYQRALCLKFGEARQACAIAGNYKNCIDIKMGDDAMDLYPCMNNGTVWDPPKETPSRLTCFLSSIFSRFGLPNPSN